MEYIVFIFRLFAGIGLFMLALYLLEESIKNLSGRNFKLMLQRITKNRFTAIGGTAIITGLLQSSSMVIFMVLAFVGAGIFSMQSGMAIVLGANLGTTFDSWVIATLGFKLDIDIVAYPAVGLGGFLLIFSGKRLFRHIAFFLLGFGLLFIGLSFMKTAMQEQAAVLDLTRFSGMHHIVFLIAGFFITAIIQSSSVTTAIALSALQGGAIAYPAAVAVVLGSETGTTMKFLVATIGGNAEKKRVALGNFLFNLFLTIWAFIFLEPLLSIIHNFLHISDPVIGLVAFSTMINLVSVILFLPLLNLFTRLLDKFFVATDASLANFITHANINEPESSMDLFRKETEYFIYSSMLFNLSRLSIPYAAVLNPGNLVAILGRKGFFSGSGEEQYEYLKQLQGEIQAFYLSFRQRLNGEEYEEASRIIASVRNAMHAAKSMKDVSSNIHILSHSSKNIKFKFFLSHKNEVEHLYRQIYQVLSQGKTGNAKNLAEMYKRIEKNYTMSLDNFYREAEANVVQSMEISTIVNFNREMFASNKALIMSVKDLLLNEKDAVDLNDSTLL